jgi:hypothetical protein
MLRAASKSAARGSEQQNAWQLQLIFSGCHPAQPVVTHHDSPAAAASITVAVSIATSAAAAMLRAALDRAAQAAKRLSVAAEF